MRANFGVIFVVVVVLALGFLDSLRGNKEAQQTMSATCLPSWTQTSPPPPSPASSPKWWSGEKPLFNPPGRPNGSGHFENLPSSLVSFNRQDSMMSSSFYSTLGLFSLFFSFFLFSLCLAGLSWRGSFSGESRYDGFGAEVSGVELGDVQRGVWNVSNTEGTSEGEEKNDPHRVSTAPGENFTKKQKD